MGIYDNVKFVGYCVRCGCRITDFQTKDEFASLSDRRVEEAEDWYGECPDCGLFVNFSRYVTPGNCYPNKYPEAEIRLSYIDLWPTVKGQKKPE